MQKGEILKADAEVNDLYEKIEGKIIKNLDGALITYDGFVIRDLVDNQYPV